jgi:hypothetical protein
MSWLSNSVMPSMRRLAGSVTVLRLRAVHTAGGYQRMAGARKFHSSGMLSDKEKKENKGLFYEIGLIFSKERQQERRKKLQEEVNRGQFFELSELQKTGGKIFEADKSLIPAHEAKVFPHVEGYNLDSEPRNTTDMMAGKVLFLFRLTA